MSSFKLLLFTLSLFLIFSCTQENRNSEETNNNRVNPKNWTKIKPLPLDPAIEKQIDELLPKLTLEQKVGQVIQADNGSITPEEVKKYRLGSVLSGGNSAQSRPHRKNSCRYCT